ncbi:MAG: putative sensory transducer protein [Herbinix sp.]|jgi:methyl-accepting chemotaxis protein|nr:putative sensory transducer protein [Herbinix sp.]
MNWFHNLKIRTKLFSCFIILVILTGIVGVIGINNLKSTNNNSDNMYKNNFIPSQDLQTIQTALEEVRANHLLAVYERNSETLKLRLDTIDNLVQQSNELLLKYKTTIQDEQDDILYQNVMNSLAAYRIVRDANLDLIREKQYDQALAVLKDVTATREKVDEALYHLVEYNKELATNSLQFNRDSYERQSLLMVVLVSICVILAILLGAYLSRMISGPINKVVHAAEMLALGDINVKVDSNTKDEIGRLSDAFNDMIRNIRNQALAVERLAAGDLTVEVEVQSENDLLGIKLKELIQKNNEVLANIASASEQVANGSKQISDSSIALSQGATEQASAIEELTASLEEISSQTKMTAQNANRVNDLADEARDKAVKGNTQMKDMLVAMEDINESSAKISRIIKVIDDIAFQTNILALNAAVEAARAGQHGKGFAVVAEEVRNLAARSANAAKETTIMIEESIKKSEGGTRIAKDTAVAFHAILQHIEDVAGVVNGIAIASNEQAIGIEQINQGIMQVSEVVQTNSATSEEGAAASEVLSNQASLLKEMVGNFKLRVYEMTNDKKETLSPEIMAMLENMMLQKRSQHNSSPDTREEIVPHKPRIVLSDLEFGKY